MFEVGNVVGVVNGRWGDRYRILSIDPDGVLVCRNVNTSDTSKNFPIRDGFEHLFVDRTYDRRKKLDKIMDNIDSLNIMERAKESAELNRRAEWLCKMETRKQKIQRICSKLGI